LSDKKRRFFYEQNLGTEQDVLFEAEDNEGYMTGFTSNYIKVSALYDPLLINEMKTVRLVEVNEEMKVEIEEVLVLS
jgi:threonylcarbamoyladenosine tRNA methylthiotransferase MtaB